MPGFDQSGPEGRGSRTGRGQGQCNPEVGAAQTPGQGAEFGRGMGRRRGFQGAGRCGSMGRRGRFFQASADSRAARQTMPGEQESLKTEIDDLRRSLAEIKARMEEG